MLTILAFVVGLQLPTSAPASQLTLDAAWRLALVRNQSVLAAQLLVPEAQLVRTAAALWPNPELSVSVANLVLGPGYDQEQDIHPDFFDQTINQVGLSQVIDVWGKRKAHVAAAKQGVIEARLRVQDALREAYYAVASAFVAVVREQDERQLAQDSRQRYEQTVDLTRKRFAAGDIAESELRVIELEGLKYANAEDDAKLEWQMARAALAQLLALTDVAMLPEVLAPLPDISAGTTGALTLPDVLAQSIQRRPDMLALDAAQQRAVLDLKAERRDAFVDPALAVGYQRSYFQASGDNPHSLVVGVALPIPAFDRNQVGIAKSRLEAEALKHASAVLRLDMAQSIADAHGRVLRAEAIMARYDAGGMRRRAEVALSVTEKSYRAGAVSYLEMLEAERTFIETQAHYIATAFDLWQARLDWRHATAFDFPGDINR